MAHPRGLHLYPLRLYAFSDGLFVVASPRQGLVGARLLAVNGVPVERIVSAVEPLVPRDNQWSRLARVPQWLVTAEVLAGLGLADGVGVARFTFDRGDALLEPVTART